MRSGFENRCSRTVSGSICRTLEGVKLGWEEARALRLERHQLHRRAPHGSELRIAGRICGVTRPASLQRRPHALGAGRGHKPGGVPARDLPIYLGALGTYRHYLGQGWVKYFGVTREEIELVIETVGEVLRGRALTRDQLADAVVERTGSKKLGVILRQGW